MECTKCNIVKNFDDFSYKNKKNKIYYMHCDLCRIKYMCENQNKNIEKGFFDYNMKKINDVIVCECGISYVCFRNFHISRHVNSRRHIDKMLNKK